MLPCALFPFVCTQVNFNQLTALSLSCNRFLLVIITPNVEKFYVITSLYVCITDYHIILVMFRSHFVFIVIIFTTIIYFPLILNLLAVLNIVVNLLRVHTCFALFTHKWSPCGLHHQYNASRSRQLPNHV